MKKTIKVILIIFIFIIIVMTISIGHFIYLEKYKLSDVGTEKSENEKYEVLFQMVGQPNWPFGSTAVKITVKNNDTGEIIQKIQDNIENDGGNFQKENWNIEWKNNIVIITLKGQEQKDKIYTVELK